MNLRKLIDGEKGKTVEAASKEEREIIEAAIDAMRREMPENVARYKIKQYQSYPYSKGYLQNEDSAGRGPDGAFFCGRYRYYSREKLLEWTAKKLRAA